MMGPELFERIDPPRRQRRFAIARRVPWLTWSADFRCFLREWARYARRMPSPTLKTVGRIGSYGWTYWHVLDTTHAGALARQLSDFTRTLARYAHPGMLVLLHELLDQMYGRRAIHLLFAAMRNSLAKQHHDPQSALYNPLNATGTDEGEFLLHADLYAPRYLFNIFDDVPGDGSGASVFLSTPDFVKVLRTVSSMPASARRRIRDCLAPIVTTDRYDKLYALLYGVDRPWREELKERLQQAREAIPFEPGQGYLLDDRKWLHGREAPTGGVSRNRIHRLIFDSPRSASARRRNGSI